MGVLTAPPMLKNPPADISVATSRFTLKRLTSFADAALLSGQWDELVERTNGDLFSSYDWCATWWKHFGQNRELSIFAAWHDKRLVGILPLYRESVTLGGVTVRVIKVVGSENSGTRCCWSVENAWTPEFVQRLTSSLQPEEYDILHIGDMPGYFDQTASLAGAFSESAGDENVIFSTDHYPHSIFEIPVTFEKYMASLSKKERSNINICYRKMKQDPSFSIEEVGEDKLVACFAEFIGQHEQQWAEKGRLGYFRDLPGSLAFHQELARLHARSGKLILLRLKHGEESVGYQYAHRFGKRIHWFQCSRDMNPKWDQLGPGRILHCELVKKAIALNVIEIDGLSGFYEFKQRLGAKFIGLQNVAMVSPGRNVRKKLAGFQTMMKLYDRTYFHAWFWRIAPWMRTNTPHFTRSAAMNAGLPESYIRSRFILSALSGGLKPVREPTERAKPKREPRTPQSMMGRFSLGNV